ncbi:adenylyltransferase/cytidyltransferase family protein, partial [Candidatus Calescamantes bacterium]|nr:adenylyltransferase/cytidyltransferase family protein [Candidatus Calescamantes bacterium]
MALNNRKLLYGGTFNPIHNGHLASVLRLKEHLDAELIIIPNGTPPHREAPDTSIEDRMEMLKLAFPKAEDITISDHELDQTGPAY